MNALSTATTESVGTLVQAFGGRYYRITHVDQLPTFFMNVVSSTDLWLFLASNGGLTAGRIDAENALFPYQSVDRIYDHAGINGPLTACWVETAQGSVLWEPFGRCTATQKGIARHIYKSIEGDRVWFEEINSTLGLAFRYGWSTSEQHGFIRRSEIENLAAEPKRVRLLDGLRNLLPAGISLRLQSTSSCLADAYKTAELLPNSSLAVYALAASIVDRAIPLEAMRSSVVYAHGLPNADILLSDQQLDIFYAGGKPTPEKQSRGIRTSYFLTTSLALAPRATQRWLLIADLGLSQADVIMRRQALAHPTFDSSVQTAADASTQRLRVLVGRADGFQIGANEINSAHHFANVLFNIMRGGTCLDGHTIPSRDFASFVQTRNRPVAARCAIVLAALPATMAHADFIARLAVIKDRDLERLGWEYLPLTFSRRHGDPSRPWNRFSIRVRNAQGQPLLSHEGNWRDIFQNWEALGLSHPEFFESMVAKFISASTVDGYNPYRLSNAGLDWEVPDHDDPWSSIGYWGDHQVIYLLKLMEWSGRFHPGRLAAWLRYDLFSYAAVPYRITDYPAMRRDPHATIEFDAAKNRASQELSASLGSDARLVQRTNGGVQHVNLTEKLLVLVLTRLTNFVPGGGIWMNTQRPEWNDANNALVGYGVSVVTLSYLRRLLFQLQRDLLPTLGTAPVAITSLVVTLLRRLQAAYDAQPAMLNGPPISETDRRTLLDAVATAGAEYRQHVYSMGLGQTVALAPTEITRLVATALGLVDHTLRANRREDGLYHSYNLLEFTEEPAGLKLHTLNLMLEGQVAILSSGLLNPSETVELLVALRQSELFRANQNSYLLYPDRQLPGFLERNIISAEAVAGCPLLRALNAFPDAQLIIRDADNHYRFAPDLVNGAALNARLAALAIDPTWAAAVKIHAPQVRAIYENVFKHRGFTGRSGSMFGYEGLGSIYWHMVAKLLVAVQENLFAAEAAADPQATRLAALYYDIRAGLGFNKTPAAFGAFPTDPYSHTPGHSGAQQPGMTGQVKEEILTRLGELGVKIENGSIRFAPTLLTAAEFTTNTTTLPYIAAAGEVSLILKPGSLGFTFCGTPVIYVLSTGPASIQLQATDGTKQEIVGHQLPINLSARLFARDGSIHHLQVQLGSAFCAYRAPME